MAGSGFEDAYNWLAIRYGFHAKENLKDAKKHYFWSSAYQYYIDMSANMDVSDLNVLSKQKIGIWESVKKRLVRKRTKKKTYQEWLDENLTAAEKRRIEAKAREYVLSRQQVCSSRDFQPKKAVVDFVELYKKAEAGDESAQIDLARVYAEGLAETVQPSLDKAYKWLKPLAEKGDIKAQKLISDYGLEE